MAIESLYEDLVSKLAQLYGSFDREHTKFQKAPNSEISRELGYSDAQFSRLINEHATEGEYQRANQNADRILELIRLEAKLAKSDPNQDQLWYKQKTVMLLTGLVIGALAIYAFSHFTNVEEKDTSFDMSKYDMLKWSFETSHINPYMKLKELPTDCEFPCYKYQGKWVLDEPYKIPFFRERNGFHYLATEVHMYNKCMNEKSKSGDFMEGYEYQKHEIWYDLREWPIDSFMRDAKMLQLSDKYKSMNFEDEESFVKVAHVHTFFRNEFKLDSSEISRSGKVIGRDIEFVDKAELTLILDGNKRSLDIQNELNSIIINRLEDFSKPVSCGIAALASLDFHEVKEGDQMSFECQLTTGRVSMDYIKTYRLSDQYIKNRCRPE